MNHLKVLDGYLLINSNSMSTFFFRFYQFQWLVRFFEHVFWPIFMICYTLCNSFFRNINTLQSFTIYHSIISHSLVLLSSTMCFHRWSFIQKGYSRMLGIVWTVNGDSATLQRSIIWQELRVVCLGVRLTIKVSFTLERKQILPQPSFPLHLFLLLPQSSCVVCLILDLVLGLIN